MFKRLFVFVFALIIVDYSFGQSFDTLLIKSVNDKFVIGFGKVNSNNSEINTQWIDQSFDSVGVKNFLINLVVETEEKIRTADNLYFYNRPLKVHQQVNYHFNSEFGYQDVLSIVTSVAGSELVGSYLLTGDENSFFILSPDGVVKKAEQMQDKNGKIDYVEKEQSGTWRCAGQNVVYLFGAISKNDSMRFSRMGDSQTFYSLSSGKILVKLK